MPAPLASEKKSVYFYLQIAKLMFEVNIYFPRECYSFCIVSENVFDFSKVFWKLQGVYQFSSYSCESLRHSHSSIFA